MLHRAVGAVGDGEDVRLHHTKRLARVRRHPLVAVDGQPLERVARDEDVRRVRIDGIAPIALAQIVKHVRLAQEHEFGVIFAARLVVRVHRKDVFCWHLGLAAAPITHRDAVGRHCRHLCEHEALSDFLRHPARVADSHGGSGHPHRFARAAQPNMRCCVVGKRSPFFVRFLIECKEVS